MTAVAGRLAVAAGTLLRLARGHALSVPSLAGAAMVSAGAAMIYTPAGVIIGGGFLLWIGTEMNRRP